MEFISVAIAIILIALISPWVTKLIGYFSMFIPQWMMNFLFLAIALKFILFLIHRGDES